MATNNLELRLAHSTLDLQGTTGMLTERWEAWQPTLDVVVNDITKRMRSSVSSAFDDASADLYKEIMSWFVTVQAWHAPQAGIGDRSLFDASLILEYWAFTPNGENFDLSHLISGDFDNQVVQKDGERPTLAGRVNVILALVLGPTMWARVDSPTPEVLRVTCQSVVGADHYNVYSDLGNGAFEFLDSVSDAGVNTFSVPAGIYRVRMAPVTSGGIVGILSNTVSVTVETVEIASAVSRQIVKPEVIVPILVVEKAVVEPPITEDIPTILTVPLYSQRLRNFVRRLRGKKK